MSKIPMLTYNSVSSVVVTGVRYRYLHITG